LAALALRAIDRAPEQWLWRDYRNQLETSTNSQSLPLQRVLRPLVSDDRAKRQRR